MPDERRRVVVLGGGVLGTSTAVHCQRAGADVVLVTEAELASGASGRSLSWLNSAGAWSDAYAALRMAGIDRYRTLFAADPTRDWLRFDGALWWTTPDADDEMRERHAAEVARGYDSHLLSRADVGDRVRGVAPGAPGHLAVHNPGEGWVSLPHLIDHLVSELVGLGGSLLTGARRCSVAVAEGRAVGVRTADGTTVTADAVVVACGAQTPDVLAEIGVHLPHASELAALVVCEPVTTDVVTVLNTPRASVRPHPGGRFAVDHAWYVDDVVEHDDGSASLDPVHVEQLVAEASALFDGDVRLRAASWRAGRKPVPADGEPVLGELDAVRGCHVVFSHSGATLGLIVGELTAGEVLTGSRHPLLAPFRPERFDARSPSDER